MGVSSSQSPVEQFMTGVHNELSPEEEALKQRLITQGKVRRAILAELSKLNVRCNLHKWACIGQTEAWMMTHPECLICEEIDEFKWYCYKSPIRECQYVVDGEVVESSLALSETLTLSEGWKLKCIHCNSPWERSS
jgi:hypothetical protein